MPPGKKRVVVLTALVVLALAALLFIPACCCVPRSARNAGAARPEVGPPIGLTRFQMPAEVIPKSETQVQMRNVDFHSDKTIILKIHSLRGSMASREKGQPLNLDDKTSFVMTLTAADAGMEGASLTDLMNHYVFAYAGAPLRDLHVDVRGGQLELEGIMHKVIDIPFTMKAAASVTDKGEIRLRPDTIQICSLNGKALMKAFGLTLEKLLDLSKAKGVHAEKNDLVIEPLKILPPPEIRSNLTAVSVEGSEMRMTLQSPGDRSDLHPPLPAEPNYMYFFDGTLRLGKLFFVKSDMEVVDSDPSDPFDFFLDYYNDQLDAGYSRNQADYGLVAYMRDFNDLGQPARSGERLAPTR